MRTPRRDPGAVGFLVMAGCLVVAAGMAFAGHQRAGHDAFLAGCLALSVVPLVMSLQPQPQPQLAVPFQWRRGAANAIGSLFVAAAALFYAFFCRTDFEVGLGWLAGAALCVAVARWLDRMARKRAAAT